MTLLSGTSFTGSGLHRINGSGIVNVAAPLTISPSFELAASGTLDGTNVVIFSGPFTWSGGTMDSSAGGGKTVFTNSATVSINSGNPKTLYRRLVDNYTTANWSAGQIISGGNGQAWNNMGGSVFDVQTDLSLAWAGFGSFLTFNNNGTLKKSAGAGLATFVAFVNNANVVSSQSGTFSLEGGGSNSGNFNANTSCTLNFGNGT